MKKLIINSKSGFKTPDKRIKIYDQRNVIFYDSIWTKNFNGFFYLPKGVFFTDNNFFKIKYKPRKVKKLPKNERDLKHDWTNFRIIFKYNPHKASILHNKATIIFDNSFRKAPLFQLVFILLHEKGHRYFKTEEKADAYAVRAMIKRGYNPSQIALAPLFTLSNDNMSRKRNVLNILHDINKK